MPACISGSTTEESGCADELRTEVERRSVDEGVWIANHVFVQLVPFVRSWRIEEEITIRCLTERKPASVGELSLDSGPLSVAPGAEPLDWRQGES